MDFLKHIEIIQTGNKQKTIKCRACEREKPLSDFYKSPINKRGYAYECKRCKKRRNKTYYQKNKEKHKTYRKVDYYTEVRNAKHELMLSEKFFLITQRKGETHCRVLTGGSPNFVKIPEEIIFTTLNAGEC